jgi:hypothetical protein
MPKPVRYNLASSAQLTRGLNTVLIARLASAHKFYESRWLTIAIGVSKMVNATVLMLLYMWRRTWDEKFVYCVTFVLITALTYLVEYGIGWFWWPHFRGIFWRPDDATRLVLCSHSPFYSGAYHISLHLSRTGSFFERLPPPVVEETIPFADLFTEGGLMLEHVWNERCKQLIARALAAKTIKRE